MTYADRFRSSLSEAEKVFWDSLEADPTADRAALLGEYVNQGDQMEQATHWIQVAAYFIWIKEGCPHGKDQEDWGRAYREFLERPDNQ